MWVLDLLSLIADLLTIGEGRDRDHAKKKGRKRRGSWFRRRRG